MWFSQQFVSSVDLEAAQKHLSEVYLTGSTTPVFCLSLFPIAWEKWLSPNVLFFLNNDNASMHFLSSLICFWYAIWTEVSTHLISFERHASTKKACKRNKNKKSHQLWDSLLSKWRCNWSFVREHIFLHMVPGGGMYFAALFWNTESLLLVTFFWSLSDKNSHKARDRGCTKCVLPMPVAPCTVSHNWAPYSPTCHTGSHCCWYYRLFCPVSLCFGTVVGLFSQHVSLVGTVGVCWVLPMISLSGSKSYVFVKFVSIQQLLCWPGIDLAMVFFSKRCAD